MENKLEAPTDTLISSTEKPEAPNEVFVDMVDLLVLVVDDLCVQVEELKEKLVNVENQ